MNTDRIGKFLLSISLIYFVIITTCLFLLQDYIETLSGSVRVLSILFLLLTFFISISLIYYNSNYQKRRKVIIIMSSISSILFILSIASKFFSLPGASIEGILAVFSFSFSDLPLIIKSRHEKRKTLLNNKILFLSYIDLCSIILITMGLLFRFMHWPGATIMMIVGGLALIFTLIGWNISFKNEVKLRAVLEDKLKDSLKEIEIKHLVIEEKQKEITDSINYAKRIQDAILPSVDFIKTHLPNSFIYYHPKDIVAGDFYWAELITLKNNSTDNFSEGSASGQRDVFFIAAADCTGHGVPGALVSVVCCNALNRTVNEFKLTDPGKILDKTRELVLESFSKNGGDIRDGMDISLISIDGNNVKWAGANNPLWYYQNNELKEIKANKQSIGKTDNPETFTTHLIELNKGDSLYLFTDGFADQFGGPKGKKFKYKQLEDLLMSSNDLTINEQHHTLKNTLNNWKGNLEQVDDICIIGIRL